MTDKKRDVNPTWEEKSAEWKKTAYETVSKDDAPNQVLIELAGIRAGDTVLDLASGTGEPSISIALHVGGKGRVTATDVTPNMLDTARQLMRSITGHCRTREYELRNLQDGGAAL